MIGPKVKATTVSIDKFFQACLTAELVIRIPENPNQNDEGFYRLDYTPRHGIPLANTTIPSKDIQNVIQFSQVCFKKYTKKIKCIP